MRSAPPVSVRCAGGVAWRGVQTLLPALAAGVFAAWLLLMNAQSAMPAFAVALAVGLVAWRFSAPRQVVLAWDGQCWTSDGKACGLEVMLDLAGWLLLRLRPEARGATRWIACTAREAGPAWHALRAAVYALAPQRKAPAPEQTAH